jgi:hypothetical protein
LGTRRGQKPQENTRHRLYLPPLREFQELEKPIRKDGKGDNKSPMTWTIDPFDTWENSWEEENPEPFPEATITEYWPYRWRSMEILARVAWHQKRWEAFKKEFPGEIAKMAWAVQYRQG